MVSKNKALRDFFLEKDHSWLAYDKVLNAFRELTNKARPTVGDIAKLPMQKVFNQRGIGWVTMQSLIHFFEEEKIKTKYIWTREHHEVISGWKK